jgi:hypothetical protein
MYGSRRLNVIGPANKEAGKNVPSSIAKLSVLFIVRISPRERRFVPKV